jgi:hypothetical protein
VPNPQTLGVPRVASQAGPMRIDGPSPPRLKRPQALAAGGSHAVKQIPKQTGGAELQFEDPRHVVSTAAGPLRPSDASHFFGERVARCASGGCQAVGERRIKILPLARRRVIAMNSRVDLVGGAGDGVSRGASGREIALRFNRALLLVGVMTIAVIWLLPA